MKEGERERDERNRQKVNERCIHMDEAITTIKQIFDFPSPLIMPTMNAYRAPRFIRPIRLLFERARRESIGDAHRLLTGYRSRKCRNVVRIDRSVWIVYIDTRGCIHHEYSMVGGFLRLKIVMLDERKTEKEKKAKDYVYDGVFTDE